MKFGLTNGVAADYLNEFAGHEIIIRTDGIEKGLEIMRRIPIKTYVEAGKGKSEYRITKANRHTVASLDKIASDLNSCAADRSLTKEMFYELYEEARRLVYGE